MTDQNLCNTPLETQLSLMLTRRYGPRYAGLLLAPAEGCGFQQRPFLPDWVEPELDAFYIKGIN